MNIFQIKAREMRNKICGFISVHWSKSLNWGDALNIYLINKISGKTVKFESSRCCHHYLVIGSIIDRATRKSVIWGTGAMSENFKFVEQPKQICAVRGPMTRRQLLRSDIICPEIYGDPALLLPKYYNPEITKKYEIGIVPHYSDKNHPWIAKIRESKGINVIDIEQDIESFVDEILLCRNIFSSSLHGVICADAYGIPSRQISLFANQVIGGQFKFDDYNLGVGRDVLTPMHVSFDTGIDALLSTSMNPCISFDSSPLMNACPFRKK